MAVGGRSYGQQCGLAASLDLLGERWTLLIVRELARGPKRFGDLARGLNGIGTNLLATRLKTLEAAGVVEPVTLAAPASVAAYDLGERGRALLPILEDLALWGFELVAGPDRDDLETRAAWAAMTMQAQMKRSEESPPEGLYSFEIGDERFWLRVSGGESVLRDGSPPFTPDAKLSAPRQSFLEVASGKPSSEAAEMRIDGDQARLESLLGTFRLPTPTRS